MTTSVAIYEKDGQIVQTHSSFIYEDSIYKVFKGGVSACFNLRKFSVIFCCAVFINQLHPAGHGIGFCCVHIISSLVLCIAACEVEGRDV